MSTNRNLNLEDIAQKAGVSKSTVSRVVNDEQYVSDKTREKVLKVIKEENYSPNPSARALVTRRTRIIGVVIPHNLSVVFDSSYYFPTLLKGISQTTNERDYGMLLWLGYGEHDAQTYYSRILQSQLMDGLILVSPPTDDPLIGMLLENNVQFVSVDRVAQFPDRVNYVTIENVGATREIVSHLIKLGRKRIGIILGSLHIADAQDRLKGYQLALEDAGIAYDPDLLALGEFNYDYGYRCMEELLAKEIDAVFAGDDNIAMGAIDAIQDHGYRIPEDIAIVGFDDLANVLQRNISLTTVRHPIREKGAKATEVLLDLIEEKISSPIQILLPTQLVIRESCGGKQEL